MGAEPSANNQPWTACVRWLEELGDSLERAYAAVLRSDLPEIRRQTTRQEELCRKLHTLRGERPVAPASAVTAGARAHNAVVPEELAAVESRVADLNRRYEALLRRARRTIDIFCRVLANSALTYPPPRAQTTAPAADVRE